MAEKKETEMEQFNEEDFLTRSEEIEYNLKEIKKATQKLNEQKQEFAKKVKEYNEERKKMNELLKSLPKNEDDDDYIFNRNSENINEQNRKRFSFSPEAGNEQDKIKRNRNSVH